MLYNPPETITKYEYKALKKQLKEVYDLLNNPPVAPPNYTELVGGEDVQPSGAQFSWQDWDISAIIPEKATAVEVMVKQSTAGWHIAGVREDGSSLVRIFNIGASAQNESVTITVPNNGRIIELYCYSAVQAQCAQHSIVGYWW